jgi:hypothetical protein
MKPYDPEGRQGPSRPLPDAVNLVEYVQSSHPRPCPTNPQAQARGSRRDPIRAQGPPCSAGRSPAGSAAASRVGLSLDGILQLGVYYAWSGYSKPTRLSHLLGRVSLHGVGEGMRFLLVSGHTESASWAV